LAVKVLSKGEDLGEAIDYYQPGIKLIMLTKGYK
jgi:hypothetical protein